MGRDGIEQQVHQAHLSFNPRARMGRDQSRWKQRRCRWSFNPRARMGRDPNLPDITQVDFVFQSTRPHGARLVDGKEVATLEVSIHAPAWGATPASRGLQRTTASFNPRARMGRDDEKFLN